MTDTSELVYDMSLKQLLSHEANKNRKNSRRGSHETEDVLRWNVYLHKYENGDVDVTTKYFFDNITEGLLKEIFLESKEAYDFRDNVIDQYSDVVKTNTRTLDFLFSRTRDQMIEEMPFMGDEDDDDRIRWAFLDFLKREDSIDYEVQYLFEVLDASDIEDIILNTENETSNDFRENLHAMADTELIKIGTPSYNEEDITPKVRYSLIGEIYSMEKSQIEKTLGKRFDHIEAARFDLLLKHYDDSTADTEVEYFLSNVALLDVKQAFEAETPEGFRYAIFSSTLIESGESSGVTFEEIFEAKPEDIAKNKCMAKMDDEFVKNEYFVQMFEQDKFGVDEDYIINYYGRSEIEDFIEISEDYDDFITLVKEGGIRLL
jgi:hypothetical protein